MQVKNFDLQVSPTQLTDWYHFFYHLGPHKYAYTVYIWVVLLNNTVYQMCHEWVQAGHGGSEHGIAEWVVRTSASTREVLHPRPTLEMSLILDGAEGGRLDKGFKVNSRIR
jgi:hypothetical protein